MLQLASGMSRLGTESAFEVLARANALRAQGRSIVALSIGQPDFQTPAHIVEAGIKALRAKSRQQTSYLIELWEALLAPVGYTLNSPRSADWRGSHVSLGHQQGLGIDLALINDMHVLPDFRTPDNIRLGIAPLYTTYAEIHSAAVRMREIVDTRLYEKYAGSAPVVT